jgi:glucosamine-6-phosphate deaminase
MLDGEMLTSRERIPTRVFETDREAAVDVAAAIVDLVESRNKEGKATVLGLATGHTPIGVYRELIRHHQRGVDFSRVVTFNLDEYYPMEPDGLQSYNRWMKENLFNHINIKPENIHIPDGRVPREKVSAYCAAYERQIKDAGGIDIQILGIGRTGHIGFNEPGSTDRTRTRLIMLDPVTRRDAAADFFGESSVPREAITMGVGSILDARRVFLMAFGEGKAPVIATSIEGPITDSVPATFLQRHPDATVFVDLAAGGHLTRVRTPWLVGSLEWTEYQEKRAVTWLSQKAKKGILKLSPEDYEAHHIAVLLRNHPSVDDLNRSVFRRLAATINGRAELPREKTMLVFSPHPDDDVISMGGAIRKLIGNGNTVHVAYQTSGNIAVFDDKAQTVAELVADMNCEFGFAPAESKTFIDGVREDLARKHTGHPDSPRVQKIKGLIRRSEASAACKHMGVKPEWIHFLDLPFYQTGVVRKLPIDHRDIGIVRKLLEKIRPEWIFLAGELSDPHGTHRLCAEAIYGALAELRPADKPEKVWLYRGAWLEYEPEDVDMVVPLTKDELTYKIFGIFKHESQKDKALFPGPYDDREFWQRAEARNRRTAEVFDILGLPEYYAMEAFQLWRP